ncbi:MAG: MCE family protein [Proteobacteria bacterium]|nr:MCE family protein [Pseudomonadota bacterium]
METKANHVLIGIFTLSLIAAILLFILWASKYSANGSFQDYKIEFNENESVTGLSVGGVVQYNGIEVGNVRDMQLDPSDPRRVIAIVRVKAKTPIKTDTKVQLAIQSLATGVSFVQFYGGSPNAPLLISQTTDKIPLMHASQTAFQKLLNSSEGIANTLTNVLNNTQKLLSDENVAHISRSLADIQAISDSLAGQRGDIVATIKSAREATDRLNRTLATAEKTMGTVDGQVGKKLPAMVDHLDQTLAHLDSLSRNADDFLKTNRGALDSFSNQGLAQLGPTLAQMRQVLHQVDRLVDKIQQNPAGYLLGRDKPVEFQPR